MVLWIRAGTLSKSNIMPRKSTAIKKIKSEISEIDNTVESCNEKLRTLNQSLDQLEINSSSSEEEAIKIGEIVESIN